MDVVHQTHIVSCLYLINRLGNRSGLQFLIGSQCYLISSLHLDFTHTGDRIRCLVDFIDRIVACSEQRETVVFQSENVQSLEGIDNLRVFDGMLRKTISSDVGTTEALGVGEVTVAEDTALAVILIEFIISDTSQA